MEFLLLKVLIGFTVGTLIGLTGLGGGVLLLPMLIFGLHVPAIIAVGTDALFNFFTKIPASLMHFIKGTVRKKIILAMAVGSIPGSYLGVTFFAAPAPRLWSWRERLHQVRRGTAAGIDPNPASVSGSD